MRRSMDCDVLDSIGNEYDWAEVEWREWDFCEDYIKENFDGKDWKDLLPDEVEELHDAIVSELDYYRAEDEDEWDDLYPDYPREL